MNSQELEIFYESTKVEHNLIWVKPLCDFFNIDYSWQLEVIRTDHILQSMYEKNHNEMLFGDKRTRVLLPKDGYVRWVQLINPSIVKPELHEKFKLYQKKIFEFLCGSFEEKQKAAVRYQRLQRLKKLYSKIGVEIQAEEKKVNRYINCHFLPELPFND